MTTDDEGCIAEMIDGYLDTSMCSCEDCLDAEDDRIERLVETGDITDDEARARHAELNMYRRE